MYIILHLINLFLNSFQQLYNRHALYLASQVGSGFDPEVSSILFRVVGITDIK